MVSPFQIEVLTLFPEFFQTPLATSVIGRAIDGGLVDIQLRNIRDYALDKHHVTDDVPYGGGAGMVMKPEPLVGALEAARVAHPDLPRILLTPQGEPFCQAMARELADGPGLILTCGRYEGVDERVRQGWIDRELSVGDYVLSGGEPGALVIIDAVMRLIPGVLGNIASIEEESFSGPGLEYPQYTRPRNFRGLEVPDVLLSGDHGRIAAWRRDQAAARTLRRRPDLLAALMNDEDES